MEDMLPFQGLRGICAIAIFLGHQTELAVASPWPNQPLLIGIEYLQAISLFFLLSGIPLARLYSNKVQSPAGRYEFWRKRLARLAPIYYLTLMLNFVLLLALAGVHRVNLKAAVESLLGCAFLLQGWFVLRFITVGGVLWQVAVFAYGYAMFPFVIQRVSSWTDRSLYGGFLLLWLFSLGLWALVFFMPPEQRLQGWWIWHVHCLSRLPHVIAGVLLGELVERKRQQQPTVGYHGWAFWTDVFSLVLVLTAIQAPIVQWYYGTDSRSVVSIALQAVLLPLHAAWLAGMVLAYKSSAACWTRKILSLRPLVALGDVSLVLYCLHLVLVFCYISLYHFLETGQWQIMLDGYALTVQIPWVHMPIQWVLVVAVSFAVSKFFESPMRKILTPARDSPMSTTSTTEASSLLSSDHQDSYDATKSAN